MTYETTCPVNGCDLQGDPIPAEYLGKGFRSPEVTHYSRLIGVEVRGVHDGVAVWQCPDCGGRWHRFPVGDYRRDRLTKMGIAADDFVSS